MKLFTMIRETFVENTMISYYCNFEVVGDLNAVTIGVTTYVLVIMVFIYTFVYHISSKQIAYLLADIWQFLV
jgi:type III secretory pathway component EscU